MTDQTKILPTLQELRDRGEPDIEASLIFQALGAASVCWERMEGTGLFNADRAKRIGDELLYELRHMNPTTTMTPDTTIEHQARREAEAKYPMPMFDTAQHLYTTDVGLAHAVVLARQEGYAARIIDERSKPQPSVKYIGELIAFIERAVKVMERTANDTLDGRNTAIDGRELLAKHRK